MIERDRDRDRENREGGEGRESREIRMKVREKKRVGEMEGEGGRVRKL